MFYSPRASSTYSMSNMLDHIMVELSILRLRNVHNKHGKFTTEEKKLFAQMLKLKLDLNEIT